MQGTFPHNVIYAPKFLLRSESPQDYTTLLRSVQHIPTINILDIAGIAAKDIQQDHPWLFAEHERRLAASTKDYIVAAQKNRLCISITEPAKPIISSVNISIM